MNPTVEGNPTGLKCRRCGEPLDDLCRDCQETELSEAFAMVNRERQKLARHFKLVPCDEEGKECGGG